MSGRDATFFVQATTLDRMHHMAHFAVRKGHDMFDNMCFICGCLMAVSHQEDLEDADRVLLCRVAELFRVILSGSHLDLFLDLEYTIFCRVPARCVHEWCDVLRDARAAEKFAAAAALLRGYCEILPRYLLLREHNWLEKSTDLLLDAAERLRGLRA